LKIGTLVRVIRNNWSAFFDMAGQIGVIVKEYPPQNGYPDRYEVLFWDEKIKTVSRVSLEEL